MVETTYVPTVWVEYTSEDSATKAVNLTHSGKQYADIKDYCDYTPHDTMYYTKTQCDASYYFNSGYHTGFVLEYLDGYSGAELLAAAVATGTIAIWSGAVDDIPTGWILCDGTSPAPDLRGKFIVGAGGLYSLNSTGGYKTVTSSGTVTVGGHNVTTSEIPNHTHTLPHDKHESYNVTGQSGPGGILGGGSTSVANSSTTDYTPSVAGATHTHTGSTIKGLGTANNNIPPYYALAYIMKVSA